jgi:tRNA A-37 threonylcarbamoyl transferase component Bud32
LKLRIKSKIDEGGFADVWRAKDELDRDVAVKIVRPANVGTANALAHAKALARAHHPNVVTVYSVDRVVDPELRVEVDCVVMELIQGVTLEKRLAGAKVSASEARRIGLAMVSGLAHIHDQGLTHGDLHEKNVMVADETTKLIDILYIDTLAALSTSSRKARRKRDITSLRLLLQQLILHSEFDWAEATAFNNLLDTNASIAEIKAAFLQVTDPKTQVDTARLLDHAFARMTDGGFVEGLTFASLLADATPAVITFSLLKKIVEERAYISAHREYVEALWSRLSSSQRAEFVSHLDSALDKEMPRGKWWPLLRMLRPLRKQGWDGLRPLTRMRIEKMVVRDVLAGYKDIYRDMLGSGGNLGTHARYLWRYFADPGALADNIISLLQQSWYTQNYVGEYFLPILPALAKTTGRTQQIVAAVASAVRNDARIVVNKLDKLPEEWVSQIKGEA